MTASWDQDDAAQAELADRDDGDFDGDFYEDDEPLDKILAILARGPWGVTAPPDADPTTGKDTG